MNFINRLENVVLKQPNIHVRAYGSIQINCGFLNKSNCEDLEKLILLQ